MDAVQYLKDNWKMTIGVIAIVMVLATILAMGGSFNTISPEDVDLDCELITMEDPQTGEDIVFQSMTEFRDFVESNGGDWEKAKEATNPTMNSGYVVEEGTCE